MADADNEEQVTFNVKSSAEAKYVVTVAQSMTVSELKQKLSTEEYANIPTERQRLIYSGRVLKDHDTVGSCKIKDGNTVHLVRGAESNQRQNPSNQASAGQPASNVPTNMAAGTRASDPLAQLTGARHAGFHGLPGMDAFGPDGGIAGPPNPDQLLRMLEDPNVAQQMNEAMNNPAVIEMLRNNPMIRNNPMARAAIENPELRRMMMNPDMIRMQMQMQRAMGGAEVGQGAFPMPGQTDTTTPTAGAGAAAQGTATDRATSPANNASGGAAQQSPNPFAALFPGGAQVPGVPAMPADPAHPYGGLFGNRQGSGGVPSNPFAAAQQELMQNPQLMQQMLGMMGGMGGDEGTGNGANPTLGPGASLGQGAGQGFNPWAGMFGAAGTPEPADNRPPEVRYEDQLRQLNDMGFFEFERNVQALRRSGGSVQGAVEYLLSNS